MRRHAIAFLAIVLSMSCARDVDARIFKVYGYRIGLKEEPYQQVINGSLRTLTQTRVYIGQPWKRALKAREWHIWVTLGGSLALLVIVGAAAVARHRGSTIKED